MKNLIASAVIVLISSTSAFGGIKPSGEKNEHPAPAEFTVKAVELNGNIIDSETHKSLAVVALEISGTSMVIYTGFDGNFSVKDIEPGYFDIIIRYIFNQEHLIENVYLMQGKNRIQPIKLVSN
jgi:hypothetical protein